MAKKYKIFISYHHAGEQLNKEELSLLIQNLKSLDPLTLTGEEYAILKDISVVMGDIDPNDPKSTDSFIRNYIRKNHLRNSDVTIVILGNHTKCRTHVTWELEGSLRSFGSFKARTRNGLVILVTDSFVKENTSKKDLNNENCKRLINLKNTGSIIFRNVEKGYAVVGSFSKILEEPHELIKLIKESLSKKSTIEPYISESIMTRNAEKCPTQSSQGKVDTFLTTANKKTRKYFWKNLFSKKAKNEYSQESDKANVHHSVEITKPTESYSLATETLPFITEKDKWVNQLETNNSLPIKKEIEHSLGPCAAAS